MTRYGMVIDLKHCVRCRTCYVACKVVSGLPTQFEANKLYSRIYYEEWEEGEYPLVVKLFIPIQCMHCQNAPCIDACEKKAIHRRDDGVIVIDKDKCKDCTDRKCIEVCPYKAIYYNVKWESADKCDFCLKRVNEGLQPYCVEMCPAGARIFGDLDDPTSEVHKLVSSGLAKPLLSELGTNPSIYYIPHKNEVDSSRLYKRLKARLLVR